MKKVIPESSQERKDLLLATLVNPEVYFWIGFLLFGTAAVGWFFIGVGVLFALVPSGLGIYWFLKRQKSREIDPS